MAARPLVLVMGVSGSGKSGVGAALAALLAVPFQDADALHPPANIARMHAGIPLTDADRAPWLAACAAWLGTALPRGGVLACSALRRRYRDRLRAGLPPDALRVVFLAPDRATLAARLAGRIGHFMPASLLASQLATLEPPGPEEGAVVPSAEPGQGIAEVARQVAGLLGHGAG